MRLQNLPEIGRTANMGNQAWITDFHRESPKTVDRVPIVSNRPSAGYCRQDGFRCATGSRPKLHHAARFRKLRHGRDPALHEPGTRDDRPDLLGGFELKPRKKSTLRTERLPSRFFSVSSKILSLLITAERFRAADSTKPPFYQHQGFTQTPNSGILSRLESTEPATCDGQLKYNFEFYGEVAEWLNRAKGELDAQAAERLEATRSEAKGQRQWRAVNALP